MLYLGDKFKRTREKKRITIDKVYQDIKIHPKIIIALEEEDMENLPNPVYVKSFIKEYAKYLGLDVKPLLKKYSSMISEEFPSSLSLKKLQTKPDYIKTLFYFKKFLYLLVFVIVILIISWTINKINNRKVTSVEKDNKIASVSTAPIEKEMLVPKGKTLKLRIETLKDTWVEVKADGNVIFKRVLDKGKSQEFKASKNFKIWVGKASGVKLYLNDIPLGSIGTGVVKNILIDRSGINFPND